MGGGGGGGGGVEGIHLFVMKPLNEHWSQVCTYGHWIATNYTMHVGGQFLIYQLHMNGMYTEIITVVSYNNNKCRSSIPCTVLRTCPLII